MSKKQILAILTVVFMAIMIILSAVHESTTKQNRPRTENTTQDQPSEDFVKPEKLNSIFMEGSNYEIKETQKNKKMTTFLYNFNDNDSNQEQDVFREFGNILEKNGYEHILEVVDGAGYRNQYELLYNDIHVMIYTESSPEKIALSITDFNEEV